MAPKKVMKSNTKASKVADAKVKAAPKALTKKNVKAHTELLAKGAENEEQALALFAKLDTNSKQCLWKHFELQRKSNDADDGFQQVATKGAGSMGKKMKLMAGFIMDKGNIGSNYQQFYQSVSVSRSSTYEEAWLSLEKALGTWGKTELYERVKAGTIAMRKNPKDPRFPEFREEKTTTKVTAEGTRHFTMGGKSQAAVGDMMNFFNQDAGGIEWDGFGFDNQSSSSQDNPMANLGKLLGIKPDRAPKALEDKVKEEDAKMETMSAVGDDDGADEIHSKFLGMKKILVKHESALQSIPADKYDEKSSKLGGVILVALGKALAALNEGINNKNKMKKQQAKSVLIAALAAGKKAREFKAMMKCQE